MIFLSQRPNTDPQPVERPSDGKRGGVFDLAPNLLPGESGPFGQLEQLHYSPRPEFTQTRDPKPWITRQSYTHTDRYRYAENVNGVLEWLPRHEEFDTPVNPILTALRQRRPNHFDSQRDIYLDALNALRFYSTTQMQRIINRDGIEAQVTRDHIIHAERVLRLLIIIIDTIKENTHGR